MKNQQTTNTCENCGVPKGHDAPSQERMKLNKGLSDVIDRYLAGDDSSHYDGRSNAEVCDFLTSQAAKFSSERYEMVKQMYDMEVVENWEQYARMQWPGIEKVHPNFAADADYVQWKSDGDEG